MHARYCPAAALTARHHTTAFAAAVAVLLLLLLSPQVGAGSSLLSAGSHISRVAREVWASQGARGLFLGGTARVLKRAISTAITWTLFEEAMRRSGGGGGGGG